MVDFLVGQEGDDVGLVLSVRWFHPDEFLLNLLIFFIRMILPDEFKSNLLGNFIRMTLVEKRLPGKEKTPGWKKASREEWITRVDWFMEKNYNLPL